MAAPQGSHRPRSCRRWPRSTSAQWTVCRGVRHCGPSQHGRRLPTRSLSRNHQNTGIDIGECGRDFSSVPRRRSYDCPASQSITLACRFSHLSPFLWTSECGLHDHNPPCHHASPPISRSAASGSDGRFVADRLGFLGLRPVLPKIAQVSMPIGGRGATVGEHVDPGDEAGGGLHEELGQRPDLVGGCDAARRGEVEHLGGSFTFGRRKDSFKIGIPLTWKRKRLLATKTVHYR